MTLPASLILEKNKPNAQSAWVVLLEAWLTDGTLLRYARAHKDIIFARADYGGSDVVAHWKMNDNLPTTTVIDSSTGGYHGTFDVNTEDESIPGHIGTALGFDGAADYVDCSDPFQLTFQGSFSVSMWVKPTDGQPGIADSIFGAEDDAGDDSGVRIRHGTDGKLRFYYESEGNDGNYAETASVIWADGPASTWTHIVCVADSTVGGVGGKKIYIDGVEATLDSTDDGSTAGVTFSAFTSAQNLYFGAWNHAGAHAGHYTGGIDNVMLFDTALSQEEIDILYNPKSSYSAAACIAHYKLNDYLATTAVVDSVGTSDGTLAGGKDTIDISIQGQVNRALDFDGAADYVDCNDPFQLTFQGSFSFSLWVKPDDGQPGALENFLGSQAANDYITLGLNTAGAVPAGSVSIAYNSNGNSAGAATANAIFANGAATSWTHLVFIGDSTVDGIGGLTIYVDGVLADLAVVVGDTTGIVFADFATALNLFIGANNAGGPGAHFAGGIDNVQIYQRALTPDDIDELYNDGAGTESVPDNYGAGTELVPITYTSAGFGLDATKLNQTGEIPTLNLNINDVGLVLRPYLRTLDGAIGSTIRLIVVNTAHLAEDYSELTLDFEILSTSSNANTVTFKLGAPHKLYQRFPMERDFALYCQFRFRDNDGRITPECGYTPKNLVGYTLNNPVEIEATAHGFATGDSIRLDDVDDPTPSLDGTYTITWINANEFSLDGINGGDYAGAWAAGGTAGYALCPRSLTDCQDRENSVRFGGAPGLQEGGLRLI